MGAYVCAYGCIGYCILGLGYVYVGCGHSLSVSSLNLARQECRVLFRALDCLQ